MLTKRWTENQSWELAHRSTGTICVLWWFLCKGDCDSRTRGTGNSVRMIIGSWTCCDLRSSSVCYTCANWNPSGKMHLKCFDTWAGGIGPSLRREQDTSTVQTKSDLETSWTTFYSPQAVPLQDDVTIALEIDCVNPTLPVVPWTPWTFGSAAPTVAIYLVHKFKDVKTRPSEKIVSTV